MELNSRSLVRRQVINRDEFLSMLEHLAELDWRKFCSHTPYLAIISFISATISVILCSFCRMLSVSCSGGRCVMSSLARGFFISRLTDTRFPCVSYFSTSFAEIFHARSFSSRFFHQATHVANSSNWMGAVLV